MLDFISSVAVLIAALTFIAGVSAWRRGFVSKRHIQFAESLLALFYEAEDVIKQIRNPSSFVGEGNTRNHDDKEFKEDSLLLDRAYIVIERYQKSNMLFSEIKSMRYRAKAVFGSSATEPFDELDTIINEILNAARMLGSYYWPRQGRVEMAPIEFKKHLEDMENYEAVFWMTDRDEISPRVQKMIKNIEDILQVAFVTQDNFVTGALDDIKNYLKMCGRFFKKQEHKNN